MQAKLVAAAARSRELLAGMAKTEYALGAFREHEKDQEQTYKRLKHEKAVLDKWQNEASTHKDKLDGYQKSTFRRFAYKVGGKGEKFDEKTEQKERACLDAHAHIRDAEGKIRELEQQMEQLGAQKTKLAADKRGYEQNKEQLDRLYHDVFDGPTPGHPEEDAAENKAKDLAGRADDAAGRLEQQTRALYLMNQAAGAMKACCTHIAKAEQASTLDIIGIADTYADLTERSELSKASQCASQAAMLQEQARQLDRRIPAPPRVTIAQGNFLGDVLFDSTFSDFRFHQKIKASAAQARDALLQVQSMATHVRAQCDATKQEAAAADGAVRDARAVLQGIRQSIIEGAAPGGHMGGGSARPARTDAAGGGAAPQAVPWGLPAAQNPGDAKPTALI